MQDEREVTPPEVIQAALAALANGVPETAVPKVPRRPRKHGLFFPILRATSTRGRERAWVLAGYEAEAKAVASSSPGGRNNQLNESAFCIGTMLHFGCFGREEAEQRLQDASVRCQLHLDNAGMGGVCATIKSGLDAGELLPRSLPDNWEQTGHESNGIPPEPEIFEWRVSLDGETLATGNESDLKAPVQEPGTRVVEHFEMFTLEGLLNAEFPQPNWVVKGILSEGLNILAGKPKQGKSMLALNLALTVAGGGQALQSVSVTPGDVLYLSLEDKHRRVQDRSRKMVKVLGEEGRKRLIVVTSWPKLERGGMNLMNVWAKKVERPTLVIIDVWSLFRPSFTKGGNMYEQDYQHMSVIKKWADKYGLTVLVLHHCRKGASEDVLEEVSGTMGLTGVADGVIVLTRARGKNEAKVLVTGRDVQDSELALEFDPETLCWKSHGAADQHIQGKLQVAIVEYLKRLNGNAAFAKDIATAVGAESSDNVRPVLFKLMDRNIIRRSGNAWAYPGEALESDEIEFS